MKILHFSALDGHTGAGAAAARIHSGLLERGVDSHFCVAHRVSESPNSFTPKPTFLHRLDRKVRAKFDDWLIRGYAPDYDYVLSSGLGGFNIGEIVKQMRPDVVHLHWIAGNSFKIGSLAGLRTPVVWRLADMWPFCGMEHLEVDAHKYTTPVNAKAGILASRTCASEWTRRRKLRVYQTLPHLRLAAPSGWMARETMRSALLGERPLDIIPTGCDSRQFYPVAQQACREALGLPRDSCVVLVGATSMRTQWKGVDLFVQGSKLAFGAFPPKNPAKPRILTFGADAFSEMELEGLVDIEHLGAVRDKRLMRIIYNAADVFVAPSRMENLANTVLESLACGTPVVAFDIGGMPDAIEHEKNGFLARPFDTEHLAEGIRFVLSRRGDPSMRLAAREKMLRDFSLDREIDLYIDLYARMLAEVSAGAGTIAPAMADARG